MTSFVTADLSRIGCGRGQEDRVSRDRAFRGKKVIVTGTHSLHPGDREIVASKVVKVLKDRPDSLILGGYPGADCVAFIVAAKAKHARKNLWDFRLRVVLPGFL